MPQIGVQFASEQGAIMIKDETLKLALQKAYLAGFNASGEGYNGEYPFGDKNQDPEYDTVWCKDRDNKLAAIKEALAQPEERNFCPRCGKRTQDLTTIHTCTPPQEQA
jgi:hypothetical protein